MSVLMPAIALVAADVWGSAPTPIQLLLPVPGDLRGVPEAISAVAVGVALWRPAGDGPGDGPGDAPGMVGLAEGTPDGLRWRWLRASGAPVAVPWREARRSLREAVLECGRDLADLDVGRDDGGRIAVEEAEWALSLLALPRRMPDERVALMRDGVRLLSAARWAAQSTGAAVSASAAELRRVALSHLERAAREAIEAALRPAG